MSKDEPPQAARGLTLEDMEIHEERTRQNVRALSTNFSEKVLEYVEDVGVEFEDPLGIAEGLGGQQPDKLVRGRRAKGKKKLQENIFRDFGKEHDKSALHEVEVGGRVITRANFKRFWQCDRELSRWLHDLEDHKRNDKLEAALVERANPDVQSERAELAKFASIARSRGELMEKAGIVMTRRPSEVSCVQEMRDLQNRLKPKTLARRKAKKFDMGIDLLFGKREEPPPKSADSGLPAANLGHTPPSTAQGSTKGQRPRKTILVSSESEDAVFRLLDCLMRHVSTLEEAFERLDRNGNGILSMAEFVTVLHDLGFQEDVKFLYGLLETNLDGYINLEEFLKLRPYLLKGLHMQKIQGRDGERQITSSRQSGDTGKANELDATGGSLASFRDQQCDASSTHSHSPGRRRASVCTTECTVTEGDHLSEDQDLTPRSARRQGVSRRRQRLTPPQPGKPLATWPPAVPSSQPRGPRLPQMPQTLSLLLFRNADKLHVGEAVFVNRWPLPALKDLLVACAKGCRPVVGPAVALLTPDLEPVRSCEEVRNGGVYLLKGQESLDPPPLLFSHQETKHLSSSASAPSLRRLSLAKDAIAADHEIRLAPSPLDLHKMSVSRGGNTWMSSQASSLAPPAGSPPWSTQGLPPTPQRVGNWQADPKLGYVMMWSGLGQLPRHKDFHSWQPALRGHRSVSRGSIDRSSALTY